MSDCVQRSLNSSTLVSREESDLRRGPHGAGPQPRRKRSCPCAVRLGAFLYWTRSFIFYTYVATARPDRGTVRPTCLCLV